MGYKAKKKLYKLIFADEDMNGLEVIATSISMERILRMQELSAAGEQTTRSPAAFRELVETLAGAMLSWNLEDEFDQPVPVTVAGILAQDPEFVMEIVSSWTLAITGASGPLGDGSTSGGSSALEASMPMEPLSPNPAS